MWWLLFVKCLYGTGRFGTVAMGMVTLAVFLTVAMLLTLASGIPSKLVEHLYQLITLMRGL